MASVVRLLRYKVIETGFRQIKSPILQRCYCACSSLQKPAHPVQSKYCKKTLFQPLPWQMRYMSGGKRNFFGDLIDNIKQEMQKNKEMKESLKKFREEADKLEHSEALKKAREKYQSIESETTKGSEALKETLTSFKGKLKEQMEEVEKSEFGKVGKGFIDEVGKTAEKAAKTVSKGGQAIGESPAFKSVAEGVKTVKKEIDDVTLKRAAMYKAPKKLRKREEYSVKVGEDKPIEANTDATGVVMHKDSRFYQSWQNFKDNNQFVNKMFDMKTKYDESDNLVIRATRTFTDKVTDLFGGIFSTTEMSEVLTEITKMDPNFDKEIFLNDCKTDIIPNVLEALVRGDLEILKDWCHEGAFNTLAHPIKQAHAAGYVLASHVLDVSHVDIAAGKIMEQGPVLIVTFSAQQIVAIKDARGKVVEGDSDKIRRIFYVWALCRDQEILDPKACWRLIDMSQSMQDQWL